MRIVATGLVCTLILAAPNVLAQDSPNDVSLNADAFRSIQRAHVRHGKTVWKENTVRGMRSAFVKDGQIDASEQMAIDLMLQDSFEMTIVDVPSGRRIDVASKLEEPAKAVLRSISATDLEFANKQKPDESDVAYLMRQGVQRETELAQLVVTDPEARREYSHLLAERIQRAFLHDRDKGNYDYDAVRAVTARLKPVFTKLQGEDVQLHSDAVRDAFAIAWGAKRPAVPTIHGQDFYRDKDNMFDETKAALLSLGYEARETEDGTIYELRKR